MVDDPYEIILEHLRAIRQERALATVEVDIDRIKARLDLSEAPQ